MAMKEGKREGRERKTEANAWITLGGRMRRRQAAAWHRPLQPNEPLGLPPSPQPHLKRQGILCQVFEALYQHSMVAEQQRVATAARPRDVSTHRTCSPSHLQSATQHRSSIPGLRQHGSRAAHAAAGAAAQDPRSSSGGPGKVAHCPPAHLPLPAGPKPAPARGPAWRESGLRHPGFHRPFSLSRERFAANQGKAETRSEAVGGHHWTDHRWLHGDRRAARCLASLHHI